MRLQLANAPHVVGSDDAVSALAPRDAALLAWLALEGPTPRTRLAVLLWPRATPESAGNALRQRLFQLGASSASSWSAVTRPCALAEGVEHDLARLAAACSATPATSSAPSWSPGWRSSASAAACARQAELEGRADAAERARDYAARAGARARAAGAASRSPKPRTAA